MLTPQKLSTLKTAVLADPTAAGYRTAGDSYSLKAWLDGASTTSVWRTDAPVAAILDGIDWTKFTPTDTVAPTTFTPDGTTAQTNLMLQEVIKLLAHLARTLDIQIKQMNLQMMLVRQTVDATKPTFRNGVRDAVIQLPAGAAGALIAAGGASGVNAVQPMTRIATRAEAALAGAPTQTGTVTASALVFEGAIDSASVDWLINN